MPRTRRRRYWIGAALGALALASPVAIAAAPAAAQGMIQFSSVGGDGSGDLTVTVTSDYPLTDWTISLSSGTSSYTLDDFGDFTDQSAPFSAGVPQTYVLNASAAQRDLESTLALPPGSYTATAVSATDSNGDTLPASQTLTGSFGFLAQPTLAITGSTFNTTQPNQPVTIKGQITGCSTLACPASWLNTPVTVTDVTAASPKPQWTSTGTTSPGSFSVGGVTGVPGDSYSASVSAVQGTNLAATAPATTQDVPQYAQTSLTGVTAAPAPYGKQSITGQLTYEPPSGLTPVDAPAGVLITATAGKNIKVSTTTGSNGDFRLALPPITGTTPWLITSEANDLDSTPFLAETEYSLSATQLWPVKITLSASLDKYDFLTVSGCMSTTISQPPPADDPPMYLQWRSRRSGPWHYLGWSPTMTRDGCAGLGFIGGRHTPPAPSAYYRAYITGDNVYAPAVSASTGRVWKYPTQFHPFQASSQSVAAGHKVTISGTLQYQDGSKWRGYGNQRVAIIYAGTRNAKTWYEPYGGSVKTNSKGEFSWTFSDTFGTEYWSANYDGNATHLVTSAKPIRIKVHGSTSAKPASRGQPVSLLSPKLETTSGTVWPFMLSDDPLLALMGD